jgi:hypothetical protein
MDATEGEAEMSRRVKARAIVTEGNPGVAEGKTVPAG